LETGSKWLAGKRQRPASASGASSPGSMTAVEVIARALKDAGVRRMYGVPGGGSVLDLIEAGRRAGIRFVLTAAEGAAAMMAATGTRLGRSSTATAVTTRCVRPRRRRSIAPASAASRGFPSIVPLCATTVSAARTAASGCRAATARALATASRRATRSGRPLAPSSIRGCVTSNGMPRQASSSLRRGEAEARMRRMRRT